MLNEWNALLQTTTDLDAMRASLFKAQNNFLNIDDNLQDDGKSCRNNELHRLLRIVYGKGRKKEEQGIY